MLSDHDDENMFAPGSRITHSREHNKEIMEQQRALWDAASNPHAP